MNTELKNYVKSLLDQRKDPQEIKKGLITVGWPESEIDAAISELSGMQNPPLPPMSTPAPPSLGGPSLQNKNQSLLTVFINLLSFILLIVIATAFGILMFQIINKYFPDSLSRSYYSEFGTFSSSSIHYSIASLIVTFPIYLFGIWSWLKSFKKDPEKNETLLTKWLTYFVLLIAGGLFIGDLIAVIYNFLEGELSPRFMLKALVIMIIGLLVFGFYFLERKKIQYKKIVAEWWFIFFFIISTVLVVGSIVLGFFAGGTPAQERLRKFDQERSNNLQQIAQGINSFTIENLFLPKNLQELQNNTRYGYYVSKISDPETNKEYEYSIVSNSKDQGFTFELCADFSLDSKNNRDNIGFDPPMYQKWFVHDQGHYCQNETIIIGKNQDGYPNLDLAPVPAKY